MSDPVTHTAVLPVAEETVGLLLAGGACAALLDGTRPAQLAADDGIGS